MRNHPTSLWSASTFDEPHVMNAVASWKPGGGWEIGARYQLASGRPDTPVIGATYDADTGKYVPVKGIVRSIRMPLFSQLDVRIEHDWLFQAWQLGLLLHPEMKRRVGESLVMPREPRETAVG